MANIKDLAKYCGVSVTTVSYALNDSKEISEETKRKIKEAAKELNYVPSAYARGLKNKRTYNIGVFIPGFEGPIHPTILSGIADILTNGDVRYNMLVTIADDNMVLIKERSIDLAIIMDSKVKDETIMEISQIIPIITFDKSITGDNIYPTTINNKQGMFEQTINLINKGCKNIGYVKGSKESYHNKLRFDGYIEALKENNIRINNDIIFNADAFTEQKGYQIINEYLQQNKLNFDALICGNDELAIGAMKAIKENNYRIPTDVKVSGFDNIDKGNLVIPSLSTVSVNWFMYGRNMAKLALDILSKNPVNGFEVHAKLIERESTK